MIEFMGKSLTNPLIVSSCIATESAANILCLAEKGIQGAILKSCADYYRKTTTDMKRQFAVESNNYTYASSPFEKEILTLDECISLMREVKSKTNILLIPSFTAASLSIDDWLPSCRKLKSEGADGIQLDFFYMGNIIGTDGMSDKIVMLLKNLSTELNIPVMPKLNINLPKDYIIPLIVKSGVEYVSLLDSIRSPYLTKENGQYLINKRLDAETTSCFGSWQLPLTISYTYTASKHGLKVCAGGGITCSDDVGKLLAAGALTVQSATFLTKYPDRAGELISYW